MLSREFVQAKTNIEVILRERGKIIGCHESHNIFVAVGTAWLAKAVFGELSTFIKYMGFGIGGSKQVHSYLDAAPFAASYLPVGAHSQTDQDALVSRLERPICISSSAVPVTPGADIWLKQVASVTHPTPNSGRAVCVLTSGDVNFGSFTTVHISEMALFTSDADPLIASNQCVAYDTCVPFPKHSGSEAEIRWTITF